MRQEDARENETMSNRIHQGGNAANRLASSRLMRTLQITLVGELDWSEERLLETDRVETEKALDQLLAQGVVQDVPADSVEGVKHLTTRWEKCWRMREGKWKYKVRFVGREYKWQEFHEDLFAPGASHCTSRIIDYLALKKGYTTFAFDAIDAYFQAPETENIVVDPPPEYLKRLEDAGGDTNIK